MTTILRVPHTDEVLCRMLRTQQPTRVVHYISTIIWCYDFEGLYNDQLSSVIEGHGIDCDCDGWAWNEWDD